MADPSIHHDTGEPATNALTCTAAQKIVYLERPQDLRQLVEKAVGTQLSDKQIDALWKVLENYVNRGRRAAAVPEPAAVRRRLQKLERLTDELSSLLIQIEQIGEGDWFALTRAFGHQALSKYCVEAGLMKQVARKTMSELVAVDRRAWASFEGFVYEVADIFEQNGRRATAQCTNTFPPTPFVQLIEMLLKQIPADLRNPGRQVRLLPESLGKSTQTALHERADGICQRK